VAAPSVKWREVTELGADGVRDPYE